MTIGKINSNFILLFLALSSTLVFGSGGFIVSIGPASSSLSSAPASTDAAAATGVVSTSAATGAVAAGASGAAAGATGASGAAATGASGAAAGATGVSGAGATGASGAAATGSSGAAAGATGASGAAATGASGAAAGATGASGAAATGAASANGATSGGGGVNVSKDEFKKAVTDCYAAATDVDKKYDSFIKGLKKSKISSKKEAAMFLAQILHESGGLQYTAEIACKDTGCPSSYPLSGIGKPGKTYFGRGYIQLTWDYNYDKASKALYGDSRLVDNPEQVATNDEYAWGVSFWFWDANVHNAAGVQQGKFGAATNAINGPLECKQKSNPTAVQKRNDNYAKCLKDFGITDAPDTSGC